MRGVDSGSPESGQSQCWESATSVSWAPSWHWYSAERTLLRLHRQYNTLTFISFHTIIDDHGREPHLSDTYYGSVIGTSGGPSSQDLYTLFDWSWSSFVCLLFAGSAAVYTKQEGIETTAFLYSI